MPVINGVITIRIIEGKARMETSLDPVIVCQALIRVLAEVFQQKILGRNISALILP